MTKKLLKIQYLLDLGSKNYVLNDRWDDINVKLMLWANVN
jgi:hypothetical protein